MSIALKKRVFNFRSFLLVAVAMVAAILFMRLNFVWYPLGFILLSLEITALVGLLVFYHIKKAARFKGVACIAAILFAAAAGFNFYFTVSRTQYVDEETVYLVGGKADEINYDEGRVLLKDVILNGADESGKILLYTDFETYPGLYSLKVGDILIFETRLTINPLVQDGEINAHAFRSGIKYRCYEFLSESKTALIEKAEADLFQKIGEEIRYTLTLALGSEHGEVAYGMFTGDKSGISEGMREAYSASGLGHLLAVSGLHIGFLSMALLSLLRLMRLKRLPSSLTVIAVLWLYAFFTGFSPSVLRAVIMSTVMLAATLLGRRYDPLNALCAAVSFILLFTPIFLFEYGFILSVGAVFGMILFRDPIANAFKKIRVPDLIARSVGTAVSVQLGILPAMIYCFESVQIYALVLNVLLLPLAGIAFVALLVTLILTMILRPLIILLRIAGVLMAFIDSTALSVAALPFSVVKVGAVFGKLVFTGYAFYFAASRFTMRPRGFKARTAKSAAALLLCAVVCFAGIPLMPRYGGDAYLAPVQSYGDVTTVVRDTDRVYIIGDFTDYAAIDDTLRALNIRKVDGIFLNALTPRAAREIVRFSHFYRAGKIFAYEKSDLSGLSGLAENGIDNFYAFDGSASVADGLEPITRDGKHLGYTLLTERGEILFCGYRTSYSRLPAALIDRCYAIRGFMYLGVYGDRIYLTNMERGFDGHASARYQYSNRDREDGFLFDFIGGKIHEISK